MLKRISIIALLVILPAVSYAFPAPTGFVNDLAGVIDPAVSSKLESYLSSFESQTGVEIAIATVPSLDDRPIEDFAVDMYKQWGVGKKGKDMGALFLVAPNERKVRLEVGYGLEGAINDALAGRILDTYVLPKFKEGDVSGGIAAGTVVLVDTIVKKENLNFDPGVSSQQIETGPEKKMGPLGVAGRILFLLFLIYMFIRHPWLLLFFLSSGGGRSGGSGFSGGFGGFGGGLSGGGGASRSW